jgi:hypothetical protein
MAKPTIFIGLLLCIVGLGGFFAGHPEAPGGHVSYTALLPAAFGLAFIVLGGIATHPAARMHAMHAAALLGLLAIFGSGCQLYRTLADSSAPPAIAHLKLLSLAATLVLSLVFLVLCIRSFIHARRARKS